eukprot:g13826.t1
MSVANLLPFALAGEPSCLSIAIFAPHSATREVVSAVAAVRPFIYISETAPNFASSLWLATAPSAWRKRSSVRGWMWRRRRKEVNLRYQLPSSAVRDTELSIYLGRGESKGWVLRWASHLCALLRRPILHPVFAKLDMLAARAKASQ